MNICSRALEKYLMLFLKPTSTSRLTQQLMISPFFGLESVVPLFWRQVLETLWEILAWKASFSVVVPILTRFHECNIYWHRRNQKMNKIWFASTMTIAVIETVCKSTFNPQLRSSANVDENTFDQIRLKKQCTKHSLTQEASNTHHSFLSSRYESCVWAKLVDKYIWFLPLRCWLPFEMGSLEQRAGHSPVLIIIIHSAVGYLANSFTATSNRS
jgi:hypothetical protein